MKFGVFYELQLPKPWKEGDEHKLFHEALNQVVLADELGFDYAWEVEHHFLDEYSHSSAPEVFLAAASTQTKRIRLGHGIRQVIPNYNHPARTAEGIATLAPKSVKKKLKDKGFAAKVERTEVTAGAELLGVDLGEHIQFVIDALKPHAAELGLEGRGS